MMAEACVSPLATLFGTDVLSEVQPQVVFFAGLSLFFLIILLARWNVLYQLGLVLEFLAPVPVLDVKLTAAEAEDDGVSSRPSRKTDLKDPKRPGFIQCYDPSTKQLLGEVPAMTAEDVHKLCELAAQAQKKWVTTSFAQRRMVLRTIQKYIVLHIEDVCRVCARDSGKSKVDALLGEVMTTCEKIRTINANGELWLRPSYRPTGPLMMHKNAYVEYVPLGVLGVIAPWNYPVRVNWAKLDLPFPTN